jgi:hypothetical protein
MFLWFFENEKFSKNLGFIRVIVCIKIFFVDACIKSEFSELNF